MSPHCTFLDPGSCGLVDKSRRLRPATANTHLTAISIPPDLVPQQIVFLRTRPIDFKASPSIQSTRPSSGSCQTGVSPAVNSTPELVDTSISCTSSSASTNKQQASTRKTSTMTESSRSVLGMESGISIRVSRTRTPPTTSPLTLVLCPGLYWVA